MGRELLAPTAVGWPKRPAECLFMASNGGERTAGFHTCGRLAPGVRRPLSGSRADHAVTVRLGSMHGVRTLRFLRFSTRAPSPQ